MTLFKVVYTRQDDVAVHMQPYCILSYAQHDAAKLMDGSCKTIVILSDSQGDDHPDNAGKYFLHTIVK